MINGSGHSKRSKQKTALAKSRTTQHIRMRFILHSFNLYCTMKWFISFKSINAWQTKIKRAMNSFWLQDLKKSINWFDICKIIIILFSMQSSRKHSKPKAAVHKMTATAIMAVKADHHHQICKHKIVSFMFIMFIVWFQSDFHCDSVICYFWRVFQFDCDFKTIVFIWL